MKALVYTANNQVTYRDEPDPVPAAGSVVLKIDAVGICGSDMHAYHGHDPRRVPPMILGHEFAGTIVAGPGQGKRVTGNPIVACGVCGTGGSPGSVISTSSTFGSRMARSPA